MQLNPVCRTAAGKEQVVCWRQRCIAGLRIASSIAVLLSVSACALRNPIAGPATALQGLVKLAQNVAEMKTVADLKGSFVLSATDLLFPDGLTPSPEQVPRLSAAQLAEVDKFFALRIDAVQRMAGSLVATHPQYRNGQGALLRFTSVKFVAHGKPDAVVDSDGVLFIDVSVLQAVLRTVIIHWQASGGLQANEGMLGGFSLLRGPNRFARDELSKPIPVEEETQAILEFNTFRKEVQGVAPTMELGMLFKTLQGAKAKGTTLTDVGRALAGDNNDFGNSLLFRAMDGMEAQLAEQSRLAAARYAQETFESALDFLIAHELAHRIFGHVAARERASDATRACESWRVQEVAADEFAAVLLVKQQLAGSRPARVVERRDGFEQDGALTIPSSDGGSLFLATAYRLAGFGQQLGVSGCSYPPLEQRLRVVTLVLAAGEGACRTGLFYEGLMAGRWLRKRDNNRLSELVGNERSKGYEQLSAWVIRRLMELIQPMAEERFKDRI